MKNTLKAVPNNPCLYRHPNGTYYGRKRTKEGLKSHSFKTDDRKLAERLLKEWLKDFSSRSGEINLAELTQLFLRTRGAKKPKTIEGYQSAIKWLLKGIPAPTLAHDVKPSDLNLLLAKSAEKYAASTHNHISDTINAIFELAFNDGKIASNPFEKVDKVVKWQRIVRKKPIIPTLEEFERIVSHIRNKRFSDTREQAADLAEFLGLAAIGEAETYNLNWSDIDWEKERINTVRVKTGHPFYIAFYPWLKPFILKLWGKAGKPKSGKVFKVKCVKQSLRNACVALKMKHYCPRNLRQMGIVRQLRAGIPVKLVSKYQGHQDGGILIMNTYSEVISGFDDEYEQNIIASLAA